MHNRIEIRKILKTILKDNAQLNVKNIFTSRPNPILLSELPVCLIYFSDEPLEIWTGSEAQPFTLKRNLQVNIDIVCDPADEYADDFIDKQIAKVELALFDNYTLNGSSMGIRPTGTKPYTIDVGGEKSFWATSSSWVIPYETDAFLDKKNPLFTEFDVKINRYNYNEDTIDPTLIEAEEKFL